MTTFDNREKAFENKFAHDQLVEFKVDAKHTRLMGLWAAEQLGMDSGSAEKYASSLVEENAVRGDFKWLHETIGSDFTEKGLDISTNMMEIQSQRCLSQATHEILGHD